MRDSRTTTRRLVAILAGVAGAIVLILALLWRSAADDDVNAVGDPTPASRTADLGKKRTLDSGKQMLGADKASVSGTVRDAEGTPIAGATVCAHANESELLGAGDKLPQCSTSERDGHYRIDGLWPVSTGIHAAAPQFIPAQWKERVAGRDRREVRLHAGEQRRELDITLERGGVPVRGVVKDIGGGVVEGALVMSGTGYWGFSGPFGVARTDVEGRFELWVKRGSIMLKAHAEGYAPATTDAGAPTELATIFMTPESVLGGTVVHAETGEPAAGVTVYASGDSWGMGIDGQTITDAEGRFRIVALVPGIYDLRARADELYGEGVEQVMLGLSQSVEDIVVEVHPAFVIAGKVVIAETRAPCTKGYVTLLCDGQDLGGNIDENGEVLVRAALPGTYQVEVRCEGQVAEQEYEPIVVADQNHVELEWLVHTGLVIRGIVVDGSDAPVEGVGVFASPKTADSDPRGQQTQSWTSSTDASGSFELHGLLPGSYELDTWTVEHPRLAQPELVSLGEGADLDGVRLVLPEMGRLTGIVRDETGTAVSGVTVTASPLARARGTQNSTRTGDDGRFELAQLESGSYRVLAERRAPGTTDDDLQGQLVEVAAGGETEIELVVEAHELSIRGRVIDSSGAPVSDAFVDATRMSDSAAAGPTANVASVRWGWDRQPVLSDQDGNYEIAGIGEGEYIVRAYREGGGEGLLDHVASGSTGVTLTIVDTGQIAGKVVLSGGGSPGRFDITVADETQGIWRSDSFFRTEGSFAIRELAPGKYKVQAGAPEGTVETEVVLTAGQSIDDLKLELTSKITVEGRLVDAQTRAPVPGMEVRIFGTGGGIMFDPTEAKPEFISDADGRFRVADVSVGKVQVLIMPRGFGSTDSSYGITNRDMKLPSEPAVQNLGDIEMLASRTKGDEKAGDLGYTLAQLGPDIEPEDGYLEVAVIRPGGPAANTGLAIGDRIVEVDGRSVEGLDSYRYYELMHAPPGTSIVLGLEGGKRATIVLGQPIK